MQLGGLGNGAFMCSAMVLAVFATSPAQADPGTSPNTIGLVLTEWDKAYWETPDAQECPQGLQYTEKDQWLALSEEKRADLAKRFGFRWNRGPNGENGITAPEGVPELLPFREVQSELAYGFNLDGTQDGRATTKSCPHRKFTDPDTGEAVDHQMYRVMGCGQGQRQGGLKREYNTREFQVQPASRILLEVVGVDNHSNDSDVQVRFYKGFDGLVTDSDGEFLPGSTHRVDTRFPLLFSASGKIVDGVLITDSVTLARFPMRWTTVVGVRHIRDMQMHLKLTETGAEGLLGGFEDIEEHWNMWRRGASGEQDISGWSGASIYKAMKRLADGYPDAQTGQCTAISVAYRIEASRVNIVRPPAYHPTQQRPHDGGLRAAQRELKGY